MLEKLPPKVLVIETDEVLNASVCNTIERYWFDVMRALSVDSAIRMANVNSPNVVIISSRIKDVSALSIGVKIRKMDNLSGVPIIFLVDEGETLVNYNQIDNGLIELVYRPFTPNELIVTVKNLLRRSKPVFEDKVIKYKDISMDLSTYKVYKGAVAIHLGPTEFKILQFFIKSPDNIHSRQQIIDYVWGTDKVIEPRTVDVHINRLRDLMKKVSKNDVPFINTVRGKGYCLDLSDDEYNYSVR